MILCVECQRKISEDFFRCPFCGHKVLSRSASHANPIILSVLAALLGLLFIAWGLGFISAWWLVDNATSLYFVLFIIILVAGYLYWETRQKIFAKILGLTFLLGLGLGLLSHFVMTDRKQIELNMHTMAQAALDRQAKPIIDLLSRDFEYQSEKRDKIGIRIVNTARIFRVSDYKISAFTVEELTHTENQSQAKVSFRLRVDHEGHFSPFVGFCRAGFVFEEGLWRVRTLKMYHAMGGTELTVPLQ